MPSVQHAAWHHEAQSPVSVNRYGSYGFYRNKAHCFSLSVHRCAMRGPRDTVLATFTVSISSSFLRLSEDLALGDPDHDVDVFRDRLVWN